MKVAFKTWIRCASKLITLGAASLAFASPFVAAQGQVGRFATDASSVSMGKIAPTYCSSIDGVDYSTSQYFSGADEVSALTGLVVKDRTAEGACCSSAKELSGGVCVDPVPTVQSCAAQGLVLVAGKCVVYVPETCPTSEDWFSGRFVNTREGVGAIPGLNMRVGSASVTTSGTGRTRHHSISGGYENSTAWNTYYTDYTLTFNVTDVSKVGEFALVESLVDDHFLVEVNGRAAVAAPASFWMRPTGPRAFPFGATGLFFYTRGGYYGANPATPYTSTGPEGYPGIMLLRGHEYAVRRQPITRCSRGSCSTSNQTVFALNVNPGDVGYPFAGVSATPYEWFRRFLVGGYSYYACYEFCNFPTGNYVNFPLEDTEGGFYDSFYQDIKPLLVTGQNKIKMRRYNKGASHDARFTIRASATESAGCQ